MGLDYEKRLLNGNIDEVALYNRTLTADEISQHYNQTLAGSSYCAA